MIYRPIRERNEDEVVQYATDVLKQTGYEEISFLSLSISDYSALNSLLKKEREALAGEKINFSFPSMRLDSFSEEIAEFARTVRKSGFTFAPEAGSDRLRRVINKNITDDDLLKATHIAIENGWKTLKFYFMIGLPTETKEDVEAIADLIERVILETRKFGKIQLNVSVSPHSPKSHTPFQWEKQDTKEEFLEKIYLLKQRLKKYKRVKLSWRDPEVSHIECILGRGDRHLADGIYIAWKKGARFDGWSEHFRYQEWIDAFVESGLNINQYLEEIPVDNKLPWDHIDKGVTKSFLRKERQNAYREVQTVDCKDGSCFGCGIQRKNGFGELTQCYVETEDISENLSISTGDTSKPVEDSSKFITTDHQERAIYQYRLQFTKNDYCKYLGHFDIVRAFERAFRRAKIEVVHSQGFNPRPKLSFSPPLRLGYTSEAEFVDIQVYEDSATTIKEDLNDNLPEGIEILNIIPVKSSIPSLMASINAIEYQINMADHQVSKPTIDQLLNESEIEVSRKVKGKFKTINIRPFIESIKEKDRILTVQTRTIEGRTVRVNEIISQLFSDNRGDSESLPVHKKRQLIKTNGSVVSPMEVR
jgi:radical SAM-linked protein